MSQADPDPNIPRGFVVISSLPASGKSRLGAAIAPLLGMPLLDKDDFLEALFDRLGVGDADWRTRLSRDSDDQFGAAAVAAGAAVLVSFWRHFGQTGGGTPSEWLSSLPGPLIEIHCVCPVDLALRRFRGRSRHPGHLDTARDVVGLQHDFDECVKRGPLGVGPVIVVDTAALPDARAVAARIRRVLVHGG
jgi:hypothetical protein